ncbi:alpha/beta fold hydrolase [Silvibacterium acidisoli]|uniref:alpha/beta fold hydrolase n=1 Tax=Acidobacteriaceae bacterium ZG23-2 TaxID=2883246 RepID=UPI00406C5952
MFLQKEETKVVFVHGVADTYRIWDCTRESLKDDNTIALALPGFGADIPRGFRSEKEDYVQWIIGELEAIGSPVDLVGHDWGSILVLRVASLRPDLVRSVAAGNGPISSEYEWHQLAKIWQTPGEGEAFMRDLDAEKLAGLLQGLGVEAADALETAQRVDDRMKDSILKLYRSALHVGEEWEPGLSNVSCPALIYWGRQDNECPILYAYSMAQHLRFSRVAELDCGHWVPLNKPVALAELLDEFWESEKH